MLKILILMVLTALKGINPFKILHQVLLRRPTMLFDVTAFATGDPETVKLWSEIVMKETPQDFFLTNGFAGKWNPDAGEFSGEDGNNVIQFVPYFENKKGDTVTITLAMDLTGAGVAPENAEGNEEEAEYYSFSMSTIDISNSVALKDRHSLKRPAFDLRKDLSTLLRRWKDNYVENKLITSLTTSPTTNRILDTTGEVSKKVTAAWLEELEIMARNTDPIIPPIMYQGKAWRVLLLHDYQIKDLRSDSNFTNALLNTWAKGTDNPLFTHADYVWGGLIIYRYNRIPLVTGSIARGMLLGAQAGLIGYSIPWDWKEAFTDIYKRIPAISTAAMLAVGKTVFGSPLEDYACIQFKTTYTPPA